MSQESLVSQSNIFHSSKPATSWFPIRVPSGYEALAYEGDSDDDEDSEGDSDVALWVLKPASDIEASPYTSPSPASRERPTESSRKGGTSSLRTRTRGVLKMFLVILTAGLPFTFFVSAFSWLVGGIVLSSILKVSPYNTTDSGPPFKASMAGAPVVALVVGAFAFLDFVVRRLPSVARADRQYDPWDDATTVASICVPASVLAMPLGLVMMPHLATETFGAWHALGWSATGLGVPVGGISLFFLPQLLWCDAVDL